MTAAGLVAGLAVGMAMASCILAGAAEDSLRASMVERLKQVATDSERERVDRVCSVGL